MKVSPALLREFLAVEMATEPSQSGFQLGDAHVGWFEVHVEQRAQFPGAFTKNPPFAPQSVVERRAGEGGLDGNLYLL